MWRKKWERATKGSMVIEGSLLIPVFILLLLLFFLWLRQGTTAIFLRQKMEDFSLEMGTTMYNEHMLEKDNIKSRIIEGTTLNEDNLRVDIELKDYILKMHCSYKLEFLFNKEVIIDECIYRKVLVP